VHDLLLSLGCRRSFLCFSIRTIGFLFSLVGRSRHFIAKRRGVHEGCVSVDNTQLISEVFMLVGFSNRVQGAKFSESSLTEGLTRVLLSCNTLFSFSVVLGRRAPDPPLKSPWNDDICVLRTPDNTSVFRSRYQSNQLFGILCFESQKRKKEKNSIIIVFWLFLPNLNRFLIESQVELTML
jgi:hypothetical protein